jgi:hypothetical protein
VVPDEFIIVRGGIKPLPPPGEMFSAVAGPTVAAAAAAVPYGTMRVTTAGEIRAQGGTVLWLPEHSPRGTLNRQHVNVAEPGQSSFSALQKNPVPSKDRIDARLP